MLNAAQQFIEQLFSKGILSTERYKAPHALRGTPAKRHHNRQQARSNQEKMYRLGLQKVQPDKYRLRKSLRSKA